MRELINEIRECKVQFKNLMTAMDQCEALGIKPDTSGTWHNRFWFKVADLVRGIRS